MKCKFEHDGDCCNSGAKQYMCKCKKPCNTIVPITNADRIRAMSDDELAEFLNGVKEPCDYCELARVMGACTESLCDSAMLNWLEQPWEDEL